MKEDLTQAQRQKINAAFFEKMVMVNSDITFDEYKEIHGRIADWPIDRLSAQDILNRTGDIALESTEKTYTSLIDVEVVGDINIRLTTDSIDHPLFCFNCKLGDVKIIGNQVHVAPIYLINCEVGDLFFNGLIIYLITIDSKTSVGNINLADCKINNFNLNNCSTQNIGLSRVALNSIKINSLSRLNEINIFDKSHIIGLAISGKSSTKNIHCSESIIQTLGINESSSIANIFCYPESEISSLLIANSKVQTIRLAGAKINNIKANSSIIHSVFLYKTKVSYTLTFNGCQVEDLIKIRNKSKVARIYFYYSSAKGFSFSRSTIGYFKSSSGLSGGITIGKCSIGNLLLDENCKAGNITVEKSTIEYIQASKQYSSIVLTKADIPLLILNDCSIPRFDISMGSQVEAYVTGGQINFISFSRSSLKHNCLISFSGCKIYALLFEEFSVLGRLFFRKAKYVEEPFKWWEIDKKTIKAMYSYEGEGLIQDVKNNYLQSSETLLGQFPYATIRITHSTLGTTEFTNCPLHKFRLEFNNSKIQDCFVSGGTVPSDNIIIIDDEGKPLEKNLKETHVQKASFHNQLKKVFDAQGDTYQAAQFQAKWAEHQKESLKLKYGAFKKEASFLRKPLKRLKLIFGELSQDIGIFRLNRRSNNHGESWMLALGFTIVTTGFFYLMFLWSIGKCFNSNGLDWSLIGYYFEFLTPTFNPGFVTGERPSSCSISLYYAGKAVFAYGLYQFIAAFRKHGRKK